jgi:drug/metabolite transporter (DMT)-like permease
LGRKARDPIPETAVNFWIAFGLCALALFLFPLPEGQTTDATGRGLAILSGAVTSGMGYALWYTILPHLGAARAGLAQLSVPPLAILGGVLLLDEVLTLHLIAASLVVIGGVAYGLTGAHKAP